MIGTAAAGAPRTKIRKSPCQILVVDDEGAIRHVLRRVLESHECAVLEAATAEEALALLDGWDPAVALVDVVLPGMNGLQLLKRIKRRRPDTEVLVMTSNASVETALQAIRDGAYDYLKKPFDVHGIWVPVQRAIEKRRLVRKNRELLQQESLRSREISSTLLLVDPATPIAESPSLTEILHDFLDVVVRELHLEAAEVWLIDLAHDELRRAAVRGEGDDAGGRAGVSLDRGVLESVARSGQPHATAGGHPETGREDPDRAAPPGEIGLCVPLASARQTLGVVAVAATGGAGFDPKDVAYLSSLAGQLAVALEGARESAQLVRAYESLKAAQEQLVFSERIQAVGQMAAGVAHDFNNVLGVILARAQFALGDLAAEPIDAERLGQNLETIVKTALQGAETIKRIQDYTRIRRDLSSAPVDLNKVIRDAVEISRPKWKGQCEAEGREIDFRFELGETPPVAGNVYELTQVVNNFIFNAVEAMPRGGRLTFRTREEGPAVVMQVEDTGVGMDETTRARLFDPFFTTKEYGQGLGTSVIFGIVTRHGGEIAVESRPGQGTRFDVRLPTSGLEIPVEETSAAGAESRFLPARLLLVDDDEMVLDVYAETLAAAGHQVHSAASGAEALRLFDDREIDLLITDLSMPGMNGLELSRRLKQRRPELPVILVSGWVLQQEEDKLRDAGIDHVLQKPCLIEDLLGEVQRALRQRAVH